MALIENPQNPQAQDGTHSRLAFEKLIRSISANFTNLAFEDIDRGIIHALESVCDYTGDDRGYVILFSENGQTMETIYEWRREGIAPQGHRIEGRQVESLPWFAERIRQLRPVHLPDVDTLREISEPDYQEYQVEGIRSILALPLTYQEHLTGCLQFVTVEKTKSWPEELIVLLTILCEIIASTFQRKRTEEALREANQTLERRVDERTREVERRSQASNALRDILKVLNSNRELPEVLDYIVRQACQLLGATATIIRKADVGHGMVTTDAGYHLPPEFEIIQQTRLYYNTNDLILMSRRPVVISDIQATYQPVVARPDTLDAVQLAYTLALLKYYKSMLSVPLFIKDEIYGSLNFYFAEHREFSEEAIQLALSLGDQAALAIENARLYREEHYRRQEAERRRQVAEGLRDVMAVLNSNRSLDEILQQIVSRAVNLLGSDAVAIYRIREKEQVLLIRASYGLSEKYINQIRIPVGKGIAGNAVLWKNPVAVPDVLAVTSEEERGDGSADLLAEEREVSQMLVADYRAFLSVPLVGKDDVYGAVTLYYHAPRMFTQEEIELAVAFADQASLALENARLRSESEQNAVMMERNRLARDLHDAVTQTLFSASLIAEVLPKIWERNPEDGKQRLDELRQLSRGALAEMRTLLLELRPAALTETRLSELFKQLAEAVTGRARVRVHLQVEGEYPVESEVQVSLYRITQEALNNIMKHSNAQQVWLRLEYQGSEGGPDRRIHLSIKDDGRGFDPTAIPPNHLGLGIMRERAASVGAVLNVESAPGSGTTITVDWNG